MRRTPQECRYRAPLESANSAGQARCLLVARLTGVETDEVCIVRRDACEACCNALAPGAALNPVVASLTYQAAERIARTGGIAGCGVEAAKQLKARVGEHLRLVESGGSDSRLHADCSAPSNQRSGESPPKEPNGALNGQAGLPRAPGPRPARRRRGKVGLVGWNTSSGLGYQALDLARHLSIDRWLIPLHPHFATQWMPRVRCRVDVVPLRCGANRLRTWLTGLDWLLFAERPYFSQVVPIARRLGVNVACVPNWEFLHPGLDWLPHVELMICPTRHTYQHVCDWRLRYGFGWQAKYGPAPIDVGRFAFRRRRHCRRFVFVNGWGGGRGRYPDGAPTAYPRKGVELIAAAARAAPHLPFTVYSQRSNLPPLPANVELRAPPADNRRLYDDGDVCVQPSHWEGIGLQLLECQAAGMPLVTTDAPPMNEYRPLAAVPVSGTEVVLLCQDQPISSQLMKAEDLAETLDRIFGTDISEASLRARQFIERERSWTRWKSALDEMLQVT